MGATGPAMPPAERAVPMSYDQSAASVCIRYQIVASMGTLACAHACVYACNVRRKTLALVYQRWRQYSIARALGACLDRWNCGYILTRVPLQAAFGVGARVIMVYLRAR